MKTDVIVKRMAWIACCALAATVCAMPTKQQLAQAQQLVNDLTAEDLRALKAKEKTPGDVAAAHLDLADKAETEAGKYLLLQGAFRLYVRSGDYDSAAATLQRMRGEIAELPPEVIVEIVNKEMRRVASEKAPKVLAIFRDAQRVIKYRKQLAIAELDMTAHPENVRYQRRVAECHACLGEWPKAIAIFANIGDEAAKFELDSASAAGCDAVKAADFWWNYKAADPEPFKAHAASLYRAAIDANQVSGLRREMAAKRLAEFEASGVPIMAVATGGRTYSSAVETGAQKALAPTTGPWAIPANFKAPLVRTLKLDGGVDMDFCAIPAGSFKMSNADGKGTHKVTITRPFWVSKTFLSFYGIKPHEKGDNATREVMKAFPKYDVIRMPTHDETMKLCYELTVTYRDEIPKGYVFRLPTEAELEYAVTGGKGVSKNPGKESFESHIMSMNAYKDKGLTKGDAGIYHWVRLVPKDAFNKWGLTGAGWLLGSAQEILDRYDGRAEDISYEREETDPLRWRGALMCRFGHIDRRNYDGGIAYQRLVIAPDLETEKWAEYTARNNKPDANVKSHVIKLGSNVNMEFTECPPGTFTMGFEEGEHSPLRKHNVTITRPFWIAKTQLTLEQYKTFDKNFSPNESAVLGGGKSPFSEIMFAGWPNPAGSKVEEFCEYLTKKFRSSIPAGYVFRLPSAAEWEYAYTAGETDEKSFYGYIGDAARYFPEKIIRKYAVGRQDINTEARRIGKLDRDKDNHPKDWPGWWLPGLAVGQRVPNRWGLFDMPDNSCETMLDTVDNDLCDLEHRKHDWDSWGPGQTALSYANAETDPLRIARYSGVKKWSTLSRYHKWNMGRNGGRTFRLVVGPDLVAEKKAAKAANPAPVLAPPVVHQAQNITPPAKIKTHTIKLNNTVSMEFVECPAGSFMMGRKGEKSGTFKHHKVTITRPFWFAKHHVTREQWGVYDKKDAKAIAADDKEDSSMTAPVRGPTYEEDLKYCTFLTKRCRNMIPQGYVFRPPTEAEWEYALRANTTDPNDPYGKDATTDSDRKIFRTKPNAWGIHSMMSGWTWMLDTAPKEGEKNSPTLSYEDEETDPLRIYNGKQACVICRGVDMGTPLVKWHRYFGRFGTQRGMKDRNLRLVVGPDLVAEKKAGKK